MITTIAAGRNGMMAHSTWPAVRDCKNALKDLVKDGEIHGTHLNSFLFALRNTKKGNTKWYHPSFGTQQKFHKFRGQVDRVAILSFVHQFVRLAAHDLTVRFSDCRVISCFNIFDPRVYAAKNMDHNQLRIFGRDEFDTLCSRFVGSDRLFPPVDRDLLHEEFLAMKRAMNIFVRDSSPDLPFSKVWQQLEDAHGSSFRHLIPFVHLMCVIPAHTCDVERGFSTHRVIKHRLTSRLRIVTVDSLMRVKLNGRDGFDKVVIHPKNQTCSTLDDIATPLLKNFFSEVNAVTLGDRVMNDFEDDEYVDVEGGDDSDADVEFVGVDAEVD